MTLLLAVAVVAAMAGFTASVLMRRNKRCERGHFVLGFVCGLTAGTVLRRRLRGLTAAGIARGTGGFAVRALTDAASRVQLGLRPPWLRDLWM